MLLGEGKWYRLNETNVSRLPHERGVYELSGTGAIVVYIGWTDEDLQVVLRAHIKDPRNTCIAKNAFFFRFELTAAPEQRASEILATYRAERYGLLPECMESKGPKEAQGTQKEEPGN
jgi:hypothetical protein